MDDSGVALYGLLTQEHQVWCVRNGMANSSLIELGFCAVQIKVVVYIVGAHFSTHTSKSLVMVGY